MIATRLFACAVLLRVVVAAPTFAQTSAAESSAPSQPAPSSPAPASSALPSDPTALLQLALDENGLRGANLQAWHIRATWQTLEDQGKPADQGSWEEWWASEQKYKIAYKSATVDRTFYGTDRGRYLVSLSSKTSWQFATVERLIQRPIGAVQFAAPMQTRLRLDDVQQGGVSMHCVIEAAMRTEGPVEVLNQRDGKTHSLEFGYCFVGDLPALRSEWGSDGGKTVFNSVVRFQGQYLARKIRSLGAGGTETDISLDVVEPLDPVVDADFALPPGAVLSH
jgi:hypothetical protein